MGGDVSSGSESQDYGHDHLKPFVSKETTLGQHVLAKMEEDGYIVLPQVLTKSECAIELSRLWDFVEATSPGVSRDSPKTWYPKQTDHREGDSDNPHSIDPWPHSGWKFLSDMCQSYQSGWLFGELREKLAARVFEPLYGTRELHSSKEGFTFHRPTATDGPFTHPLVGMERPRVCNEETHTNGEHFDQRASHTGLHCIQTSTALIDQTEEDGNFLCWPGSHKEHPRMTKDIWRGRSDWVPLTDGELNDLRSRGYSAKRVPANAGDVILWRSDLCHCGAPPIGLRPGFRAVSYTCMLPAKMTPKDVFDHKLSEYFSGLSGDHRPNVTMQHLSVPKKSSKHKTKKGEEVTNPTMATGRYFPSGLPQLTWRQAELYGLVKYGIDSDDDQSAQASNDRKMWVTPKERQ
jgi:hypothetical protein